MIDEVYSLLSICHSKVVKHNTIYTATFKDLIELIEITNLNLNLQVKVAFLKISMTTVDSVGNTTSEINMIVFE